MPTYEYECTKCENRFEIEQRITDPPKERCPDCRGKLIRLVSGGGGVILKGSGFYSTDYRSPDYKKQADADRPKSDDGGSKSDKSKKPRKSDDS